MSLTAIVRAIGDLYDRGRRPVDPGTVGTTDPFRCSSPTTGSWSTVSVDRHGARCSANCASAASSRHVDALPRGVKTELLAELIAISLNLREVGVHAL